MCGRRLRRGDRDWYHEFAQPRNLEGGNLVRANGGFCVLQKPRDVIFIRGSFSTSFSLRDSKARDGSVIMHCRCWFPT
jgi:hypothetical protein